MNYINHYSMGSQIVEHKGKLITTSLNTEFESYVNAMNSLDYEVVYIPQGYEHRPDLISDLFYDTVTYDWLIMMFNNISDPFQGLNVGDRLLLPKI